MPSLSERLEAARNRRAQAERPIDPSVVAAPGSAGAVRPPRGRRASAAEPDALPSQPAEARFAGPLATVGAPAEVPTAPVVEAEADAAVVEAGVADAAVVETTAVVEAAVVPASDVEAGAPAAAEESAVEADDDAAAGEGPDAEAADPADADVAPGDAGEVDAASDEVDAASDEVDADSVPSDEHAAEPSEEGAVATNAAEPAAASEPTFDELLAEPAPAVETDAAEREEHAEAAETEPEFVQDLDPETDAAAQEPSAGAEADWTPEWDSADGPDWGSAAEPEPSWLAEAREAEPASASASVAGGDAAVGGDPEIERILAGHDATELVDPVLVAPVPPVTPIVPSLPPVEDLYDGAALAVIPRHEGGSEEVQRVREEASDLFAERIGTRLNDPGLSEQDLDTMARRELASIIDERGQALSERERFALIQELADEVLGLGPIQPLLDDESISEVMVNGHDHVYVERRGRIQRVPTSFRSEERLRRVIERIVTRVGRRIDESSPLVDARLADGSRVNAVIPPLAIGGSSLTIRKFAAEPLRARDLVSLGTLSDDMVEVLIACVRARLNVIVSGGTGTGKTTLLNVLSSFIPHDERIITIEDAAELQLQQEHVVRLESRPANLEGRGEVTIRDLVRNALRMRPDRIVVGESRGGESLDMLQAMSTGHDGSLTTLHANSPRDAIARLETLVMMAGMELPHRAIREQIASAVDVIIQVTRLRDGTRRVTHVSEILGMENDIVTLQDVYRFDFAAGVDHSGRFLGKAQPTGIRPRFLTRFDEVGVPFDASLFTTADDRMEWS